jgi:hypothetical protein
MRDSGLGRQATKQRQPEIAAEVVPNMVNWVETKSIYPHGEGVVYTIPFGRLNVANSKAALGGDRLLR